MFSFGIVLGNLFRDCTIVGLMNSEKALVQYKTKLLMINYHSLSREFFYQTVLNEFQNLGILRLTEPLDLLQILQLTQEHLNAPESPAEISGFLIDRREMLKDYFEIDITDDGRLVGLPMLVSGYHPPLEKLPVFLYRLFKEVLVCAIDQI